MSSRTTTDAAPSGPRPLLHEKRSTLEVAQAAQYVGTNTELDIKQSDRHAKKGVRPVRWPRA